MTAALDVLDSAKGSLLTIHKANSIDVDVKLATASHSSLRLCLRHGAPGNTSLGDGDHTVYNYLFEHIEIDFVIHLCVGRGESLLKTQLDRRPLF